MLAEVATTATNGTVPIITDQVISAIVTLISIIWNHEYLRWGALLIVVAFGLEIITGLLEIAIYTAMIGGTILLAGGTFVYIT